MYKMMKKQKLFR